MRETKFRAWDKKKKKYIYFEIGDAVGYSGDYSLSNACIGEMDIDRFNNGEYILEQYVGLKDKNKKEIYEGDIVKNEDEDLRKIIYFHNSFEMRCLNNKRDKNNFIWHYGAEKIGNINENPELLKSETKK